MSSGRVLIVDDDREVREMLAEYLGSHGFEAETAEGGAAMRSSIDWRLHRRGRILR